MKKEIPQPRLDFYQILFRRKWNVGRWLESEGITTKEQLDLWMNANSHKFTYSDNFVSEAELCFVSSVRVADILPEEKLEPVILPVEEVVLDSSSIVVPGKESSETTEEHEVSSLETNEENTKRKNKKRVQSSDDSE